MYNAGAFISKCLQSCMIQDIAPEEYEVIVVNDGSTDDGVEVVEGLVSVNGWTNVSVVSRQNGGLSEARNTGFGRASGEYVWFVDSDDWIEENCLATLLDKAVGYDMLVFGAVDYIIKDGSEVRGAVFAYPGDVSRSGADHVRVMSEKLKMCVPFNLFRHGFLKERKQLFVPGLMHEDAEFMPRTLCEAERIRVIPMTPYCRLVREGSMSRLYDPRRVEALLEVASRIHSYVDSGQAGKELRAPMNSIVSNMLNQSFKLIGSSVTYDSEKEAFLSKLGGMEWLTKAFLSAKELKYKVEGVLLTLFPRKPVEVYSFLASFKR